MFSTGSPSGESFSNPSRRQAAVFAMAIFPAESTVRTPTGLPSTRARASRSAFARVCISCLVLSISGRGDAPVGSDQLSREKVRRP